MSFATGATVKRVRDGVSAAANSGRNDTIVGSLDAMDSFLAHSPSPAPTGDDETSMRWPGLVAWVEGFFKAVTGSSLRGFRLEDHERLDKVRILPYSSLTGASRHLLDLYDALLPKPDEAEEAETSSHLLTALSRQTAASPIDPESPLNDPVREGHLGHMTDRFGLGPSQRESLHALFRLPVGAVMALNGPPGTGKTAWIQSAVASLWVERALTVAVSRAQDSFLVFGDMRSFDPSGSKPPGILARLLFAEESNQLPDADAEPELLPLPGVSRISSLEEHRRVLREAFEQASQRLLIVSPYLTGRAVDAERLIDRIGSARARVSIAYSIDMAKSEAREVADWLESAGAEVIRLRGFHTKTLAVDDSWFTHGSFNWLSAVRQEGDRFQYREARSDVASQRRRPQSRRSGKR